VIRKGKLKPHFASDDGSIGLRGRLPDLIKGAKFPADSWFYVCGPSGMMKALFKVLPQDRSLYFLEETMGCGFGICVGCVVAIDTAVGLSNKKSCLEGCMFLGENLKTWAAVSGGHS
jgi:dihydroorotate dehydrogenase electron transfer subunit